jgi:hypothetical protein
MGLDDLRTIIFTLRRVSHRRRGRPQAAAARSIETLTINMDEVRRRNTRAYVAQIEEILEHPNPEGGQSNVILGLLRASVAHRPARRAGGWATRTADGARGRCRRATQVRQRRREVEIVKRPPPAAGLREPQVDRVRPRVAASPHCGHIIFCEPTAVHLWMREVLVQHGIPRERIAILNADETAPADRIRIAREFNGLSSEPPPPYTPRGRRRRGCRSRSMCRRSRRPECHAPTEIRSGFCGRGPGRAAPSRCGYCRVV